ncbi:hypothetical protein NRF20_16570 [Streptomyces sp. R-74717]|uniref:hypothetical protein n=1 Tax=Streptomyces sp. R-74717 TaxID=2969820 RepID=UPI0039B6DB80
MSLQEELTAVQHCLDDLVGTVGRLERSLARLREAEAGQGAARSRRSHRTRRRALPGRELRRAVDRKYDPLVWLGNKIGRRGDRT